SAAPACGHARWRHAPLGARLTREDVTGRAGPTAHRRATWPVAVRSTSFVEGASLGRDDHVPVHRAACTDVPPGAAIMKCGTSGPLAGRAREPATRSGVVSHRVRTLVRMSLVEQDIPPGAVPRSIEVIEADGASWAGIANAATAALIATIGEALEDDRWFGPGFVSVEH